MSEASKPAREGNYRPAPRDGYWLTVVEVASMLDCSDRAVWSWTAQGILPQPVRRGRKWTRWRRSEIEAYRDGESVTKR